MIFGIAFSPRWTQIPRQLIPAFVTLLLVVVQLLPWSHAAEAMTPSLALMSLFFWSLHAPCLIPPLFAGLIGIAADLTELTPLGAQAIIFFVMTAGLTRRPRLAALSPLRQWVLFAGIYLAVNLMLWLIELVIGGHLMPLGQAIARTAIGVALYPILAFVIFQPLRRLTVDDANG